MPRIWTLATNYVNHKTIILAKWEAMKEDQIEEKKIGEFMEEEGENLEEVEEKDDEGNLL